MKVTCRDKIRAVAQDNGWAPISSLLSSDTFARGDSTLLIFFNRRGTGVTGGVITVPGDSLRIKRTDHNKEEVILDFLKN